MIYIIGIIGIIAVLIFMDKKKSRGVSSYNEKVWQMNSIKELMITGSFINFGTHN